MSIFKEELTAGISLSMTVTETDGILEKGQAVVVNGDYQVTTSLVSAGGEHTFHFGYVIVPNKEAGGKATIFFKARSVQKLTAFESFNPGQLLAFKDSSSEISRASMEYATGQITVIDNIWDGGESITIGGVTMTNGIEFITGPTNDETARNIANAINLRCPDVKATVSGPVINIRALDIGQDNISLSTTDTGNDITLSGPAITGADVSVIYAYGVSLQEAVSAGNQVDVLVF